MDEAESTSESTKTRRVLKVSEVKEPDTDFKTGELYHLNLELLNPDPDQPRKIIDDKDLQELTESIEKYEVLQPILFRKDPNGSLTIVSGERRYQASVKAGKKIIPAIYTTGNYKEIALIENILRVDLTAIEEAEALIRLQENENFTLKQLGAIVSKKESTVSEVLSINKIPQKLRDKYRSNRSLSKSLLVEVAKADVKKMSGMLKKAAEKQLTRDDVRSSGNKRARQVDAIFKTMAGGLKTRLENTAFSDIKPDMKKIIATELNDLVSLIQKKLVELEG